MAMASARPETPMPQCLDRRSCLVVAVLSESRMRQVITFRSQKPTCVRRTAGVAEGVMMVGGCAGIGMGSKWGLVVGWCSDVGSWVVAFVFVKVAV